MSIRSRRVTPLEQAVAHEAITGGAARQAMRDRVTMGLSSLSRDGSGADLASLSSGLQKKKRRRPDSRSRARKRHARIKRSDLLARTLSEADVAYASPRAEDGRRTGASASPAGLSRAVLGPPAAGAADPWAKDASADAEFRRQKKRNKQKRKLQKRGKKTMEEMLLASRKRTAAETMDRPAEYSAVPGERRKLKHEAEREREEELAKARAMRRYGLAGGLHAEEEEGGKEEEAAPLAGLVDDETTRVELKTAIPLPGHSGADMGDIAKQLLGLKAAAEKEGGGGGGGGGSSADKYAADDDPLNDKGTFEEFMREGAFQATIRSHHDKIDRLSRDPRMRARLGMRPPSLLSLRRDVEEDAEEQSKEEEEEDDAASAAAAASHWRTLARDALDEPVDAALPGAKASAHKALREFDPRRRGMKKALEFRQALARQRAAAKRQAAIDAARSREDQKEEDKKEARRRWRKGRARVAARIPRMRCEDALLELGLEEEVDVRKYEIANNWIDEVELADLDETAKLAAIRTQYIRHKGYYDTDKSMWKETMDAVQRWYSLQQGIAPCPSPFMSGIYIGDEHDARSLKRLTDLGITHIINLSHLPLYHRGKFTYLHVNMEKSKSYNVITPFPQIIAFIDEVIMLNSRILIHDINGNGAAAAIVIMYAITRFKMRLLAALRAVRSCRPSIYPNEGYRLQMAVQELETFGCTSVGDHRAGEMWDFYQWNQMKIRQAKYDNNALTRNCTVM